MTPGGGATYTVTVNPSGGFAAAVTLGTSGLPVRGERELQPDVDDDDVDAHRYHDRRRSPPAAIRSRSPARAAA